MDQQPAATGQGGLAAGQDVEFGLDRVVEGRGGHQARPAAQHAAQPRQQRGAVQQDLGLGEARGKPLHRQRAAGDQGGCGRRGGGDKRRLGGAEAGGNARPLATLRRADDAERQDHALMHGGGDRPARLAGLAFRQEAGGTAGERDEGPGHGGGHGRDAAAMQVAHPIRAAWPLDPGLGQHAALQQRGAQFTRRCADEDGRATPRARRYGRSHPMPRSSCAVSNSGRPTTLEWLPDRKRMNASARPWMA